MDHKQKNTIRGFRDQRSLNSVKQQNLFLA